MKFVRLSPYALPPVRGTDKSVGYDIASTKEHHIPPYGIKKIKTDLAFLFPTGCYGRLAMRSSLAQRGADVLGGVIDPDFTGNLTVIIVNHGEKELVIKRGDRFVQIICEKADFGDLIEAQEVLDSKRGSFGSTGK